ncbi:hypothetical protein [Amycolatopsis rubida]|uniref:IrrE N-terminal-like domain-containing protein n=1 Tax=Amycolatopsis rubida TaxID=112413 RepID=A0A1I5XDR7_9PSEU|nr:hypothetical protein [Amycolatopsis rubida]SFQ30006.1 hypothetical protein SAMN05421854_110169 [Amycolatopsis rubida]
MTETSRGAGERHGRGPFGRFRDALSRVLDKLVDPWVRFREHRVLRSEIERVAGEIVPKPWSLEEFARRLGEHRGRPIVLSAMSLPTDGPDAMWLAGPTVDLVGYDETIVGLHREQMILHELCHILLCHRGSQSLPVDPNLLRTLGMEGPPGDGGTPEILRRQGGYDDKQEREAEIAATIVLIIAEVPLVKPKPRKLQGAQAVAVDRLANVLGRVPRGR